jgi:DNA-binding NarL/FixJ family response regulator
MLELIRAGTTDGDEIGGVGKFDQLPAPRAMLLFITRPGVVSENLLHAVEHEFPDLMIKRVDDIAAAYREFALPVSLILVDTALLAAAGQSASDLARFHPHAYAAAIQPRGYNGEMPEILLSKLVRGVLPMNVTLDVWLAVIRLLLHGGEYFPLDMVVRSFSKEPNGASPIHSAGSTVTPEVPGIQLAELTARENQILEMVSRGLQNKKIAAEFRLSEHTVKIHMHNIITKLGVHNRTEAVSRFRDRP